MSQDQSPSILRNAAGPKDTPRPNDINPDQNTGRDEPAYDQDPTSPSHRPDVGNAIITPVAEDCFREGREDPTESTSKREATKPGESERDPKGIVPEYETDDADMLVLVIQKSKAESAEKPTARFGRLARDTGQLSIMPNAPKNGTAASAASNLMASLRARRKRIKANPEPERGWEMMSQAIKYRPDMLNDMMSIPSFRNMLASARKDPRVVRDVMNLPSFRAMGEESCPPFQLSDNLTKGPVCANPLCRQPGHTIAVCPGPVHAGQGWMRGCFFCNQYDHYADNCPMMKSVTAPALITYLITNRAGLPPFYTHIDWVALAVENWDLVDMTSLPLTHEFVKTQYTPSQMWMDHSNWTNGRSPVRDPLLEGVDLGRLKALSSKDAPNRLIESAYLAGLCPCTAPEYALNQNPTLKPYAKTSLVEKKDEDSAAAEVDQIIREFEALRRKPMPKKRTKVRLGRRQLKKFRTTLSKLEEDEMLMGQLLDMEPEELEEIQNMVIKLETENADLASAERNARIREMMVEELGKRAEERRQKELEVEQKLKMRIEEEEQDATPISDRLLILSDRFDKLFDDLYGVVKAV